MRFLVLLLVLLAACRPPEGGAQGAGADTSSGVRVSLELPQAPAVGPATVRVYLLGPDNEGVSNATVTVTGTMTHAGMEPVIAEATPTEGGIYETESFEFDMAGDWILTAEATLTDGGTAQAERPVTVPGG